VELTVVVGVTDEQTSSLSVGVIEKRQRNDRRVIFIKFSTQKSQKIAPYMLLFFYCEKVGFKKIVV
jgi:hypothetical protein